MEAGPADASAILFAHLNTVLRATFIIVIAWSGELAGNEVIDFLIEVRKLLASLWYKVVRSSFHRLFVLHLTCPIKISTYTSLWSNISNPQDSHSYVKNRHKSGLSTASETHHRRSKDQSLLTSNNNSNDNNDDNNNVSQSLHILLGEPGL